MRASDTDSRTHSFDGDDDDSTPLEPDEKIGLLLSWVTFRYELNEVEQANIAEGVAWAMRQLNRRELLDDAYIRDLHKHMFGDVWAWAGSFRSTERNMGIMPWRISTAVRSLVDDTRAWIQYDTYDADEIAVRFHHKLVSIHPFPNGNGRHSRLMADLLAKQLLRPLFTWSGKSLNTPCEARARYIDALHHADNGDISLLLEFARS